MAVYKYLTLIFLAIIVIVTLVNPLKRDTRDENNTLTTEVMPTQVSDEKESVISMPNPASKYCEDNGGSLEMVTNKDGSQFSMCNLQDFACEEWAYYRGECTVAEDAAKIKEALIDKGLDLTGMNVVIKHHFGKYIGGSVVPISVPAGGGYVFAVKDSNGVRIVADGNGVIMCEMLNAYPDYPTYLISECIDDNGDPVLR